MSWTTKYIGKEYESCIHMVQDVLAKEFKIKKDLPALDNHAALMERRREWARRWPPGTPLRNGLIVLMRPDAEVMHAGILCLLPEPYVLHTVTKPGPVMLQPTRLVQRLMKFEGIYEVLP